MIRWRLFPGIVLTCSICFGTFVLSKPVTTGKIEQHDSDIPWNAHWIWQNQDGLDNTWLCLRKKFTLTGKPSTALTRIAVENKYWLYINGQLVAPDGGMDIRPDLNNTYYDQTDIAPYLYTGENVIALLAWYKGGKNGYTQRMVNEGGVLFESDLPGSTPSRIVSDYTWKVKVHPSFAHTSQQQQWRDWKWVEYPVDYDARKSPGDWTALSFDDTGWESATLKGAPPSPPWNLPVNRTIPMNKFFGLTSYLNQSSLPTVITHDTTFTADTGNNLQGNAYLKLNAPAGVTISIRMNEWYTEHYTTRAGVQEYTTFQWQNTSGQPWSRHCVEFAFTNVRGDVRILDIKFKQSGYNTEFSGSFICNNPRLNTLWNKSRNTSYVCMRDQFYDCPDRERSQWWGDVSEQILYSFYLFDARASLLAKKGFREFFNTQKADGSLYSTAPGIRFHLPDQNMAAVMSLGDYLLYTGDTSLVEELYPKISVYVRQYVANTRNSDGMLLLQRGPWNWIDWGNNLDVKQGSANTVVNGLFVRLMETMKLLAVTSGNSRDVIYYQKMEDAVKTNFNTYFWNDTYKAYVFHRRFFTQSPITDDRSNAWAVLAGVVDPSRQNGVMKVLTSQQNASPYQERYIEEAMFSMGKDNDALNRMLDYYTSDIDSWSQTMWERIGTYNSNNHAWAASPCYLLGAYVAGIRPVTPGFATYQVLPMMGTLTSVCASVQSPHGMISVNHALNAQSFTMNLVSPSGTKAITGIPNKQKWKEIRVNGTTVWENGSFVNAVKGISGINADDGYIRFNASSGSWRFEAR